MLRFRRLSIKLKEVAVRPRSSTLKLRFSTFVGVLNKEGFLNFFIFEIELLLGNSLLTEFLFRVLSVGEEVLPLCFENSFRLKLYVLFN